MCDPNEDIMLGGPKNNPCGNSKHKSFSGGPKKQKTQMYIHVCFQGCLHMAVITATKNTDVTPGVFSGLFKHACHYRIVDDYCVGPGNLFVRNPEHKSFCGGPQKQKTQI